MRFNTIDELSQYVEQEQKKYGETEFSWSKSTPEIISIVVDSLKKYISEGELDHIRAQLPKEVKELIS